MTQIVDDQLLGAILRGDDPPRPDEPVFTTGHWYVRLCQAVLNAAERAGALSAPFAALPENLRRRATEALVELPTGIGLVSLGELGPLIGRLRQRHQLNVGGIEVLAAALHLGADVYLSAPSPRLQAALDAEGRSYAPA
ncbi:hypothetical protein [Candidatus Poriferisodalis sp.]|uniref:hypothetical protein n=1 Tax=Candidatus Poriferisodalis sp. TaxID=3101277 RepID=UPI003B5AF1F3